MSQQLFGKIVKNLILVSQYFENTFQETYFCDRKCFSSYKLLYFQKYTLNYASKRRNFKQTYLVTYVLIRVSANIKYPREIKKH